MVIEKNMDVPLTRGLRALRMRSPGPQGLTDHGPQGLTAPGPQGPTDPGRPAFLLDPKEELLSLWRPRRPPPSPAIPW